MLAHPHPAPKADHLPLAFYAVSGATNVGRKANLTITSAELYGWTKVSMSGAHVVDMSVTFADGTPLEGLWLESAQSWTISGAVLNASNASKLLTSQQLSRQRAAAGGSGVVACAGQRWCNLGWPAPDGQSSGLPAVSCRGRPARPRCHLALSASESVSGGSGGGTRLQDTDSGKSYARKPASVQIHVHEAELGEARGEQSVRRLQHDGFVQVKGEEVEAAPSCDAFGQTAASSEFRLRRLVCQSMCSSRLERGPS